ncbi:hypothetical protein N0V82_010124 [Gnomoniopsis sp. IMI 355080]|nr:hypothetical protein N0V82_010124 [Gnomoniopsis sp. IMI 355080]
MWLRVERDGPIKYVRGDIELQLATLTEYIRTKKLRPIEWTCCSCSTEQKYRENLETLDRSRCQYPRCGVSDKGFRIYPVHNMCGQCAVFVDQRVPVTKRALKKKRDEVREVLWKIKKIYEDVDRLAASDDTEAERMANLMQAREAREEIEREKQEAEDLHRLEMQEKQRDEWVDEDGDHSGSRLQCRQAAVRGDGLEEGEEEKGRQDAKENAQKRRGLKEFLGLRLS